MKSVLLEALQEFIYPRFCLICDSHGEFLCQNCLANLPKARFKCPQCTLPSGGGKMHIKCKNKWGLSGLTTFFDYKDEKVKKVIEEIKFGFNQELVEIILPKKIELEKVDLIIPLPLHRRRENWRGFNQAKTIAKAVSLRTGIEMTDSLVRVKNTLQQAKLKTTKERKENIKDAFALKKGVAVADKVILLVDDVFTSGESMKEATKVLKMSGARDVWGLALGG